ncbi:MAG: ATP-binding protein [Clostridia bacterium]|uniref:ATP-binding protein n=1 Tax=Clostridium sp. TaxID=1506 RepID=UPI002FC937D8
MNKIAQLLDLEPNKVSTDIRDYSMMICGASGIGKTPLVNEVYGEGTLILAFESSHKGISGAHAVNIDSYSTLMAYIQQLENPRVREKYHTVVIDTLFLLDYMCEKSVTDQYGKDLIKDCLAYNQAYKIVDKKFLNAIKRLQKMNYTLVYVAHPVEKKVKLANGQEIVRYEPKVSERIKTHIIPEIDIRLFALEKEDGSRVLYTRSTPFFDARCRIGEMVAEVPFDANSLRKAFKEGIETLESKGGLTTDDGIQKYAAVEDDMTFEEVMESIMALGSHLASQGKGEMANAIVTEELGRDDSGNVRPLSSATKEMLGALKVILVKLQNL